MYTLRFPFRLPAGQTINTNEDIVKIGNMHFHMSKQESWYVLEIDGFKSEDEAIKFSRQLWAGFMWIILNANLAPSASFEIQNVKYSEDPITTGRNIAKSFGLPDGEPVDSLIDGHRPAVILSDKKIKALTAGDAQITIGIPSKRIFELLAEHSDFSKPSEPFNDDKLRVAVELYAAYFTESSPNARFLTLVMALETLAQGVSRPKTVLDLLKKWQNEVEELKLSNSDSEINAVLDSLLNELLFKKENSIRSQIRSIVRETLMNTGELDAEQAARTATTVYDNRSTLVHKGKLDAHTLSQSTAEAKLIVERVLQAKFASIASLA
jgi:hypothetical protein